MNRIKIVDPTPFGPVGLVWSPIAGSPRIIRVLIPKPALPVAVQVRGLFPGALVSSCAAVDALAVRIQALLEGEDIRYELGLADLSPSSSVFLKRLFVFKELSGSLSLLEEFKIHNHPKRAESVPCRS